MSIPKMSGSSSPGSSVSPVPESFESAMTACIRIGTSLSLILSSNEDWRRVYTSSLRTGKKYSICERNYEKNNVLHFSEVRDQLRNKL